MLRTELFGNFICFLDQAFRENYKNYGEYNGNMFNECILT